MRSPLAFATQAPPGSALCSPGFPSPQTSARQCLSCTPQSRLPIASPAPALSRRVAILRTAVASAEANGKASAYESSGARGSNRAESPGLPGTSGSPSSPRQPLPPGPSRLPRRPRPGGVPLGQTPRATAMLAVRQYQRLLLSPEGREVDPDIFVYFSEDCGLASDVDRTVPSSQSLP
jgi:hypothetical protein